MGRQKKRTSPERNASKRSPSTEKVPPKFHGKPTATHRTDPPGSAAPSGSYPKPSRDKKEDSPPSKSFAFVDRTGKVHGSGKPSLGGASRADRPLSRPNNRTQGAPDPFSKIEQRKKERDREVSKISENRPRRGPEKDRGDRDRNRSRPGGRNRDRDRDRKRSNVGMADRVRKAIVDKNKKGFGFLGFEDRQGEDAFLPPRMAERFFHGDRVEVHFDSRGEIGDITVLEHRFREIVGRFTPHPAGAEKGGWVVYERKKAREEVFAPEIKLPVEAEDWVQAKVHFHETGPFAVTAEITKVYGKELPPSADIGMVAAEYNLIEEHSQAAELEAKSFKLEVPGKDLEGRVDLREVPFITIDGETARDFDDAVYVERHPKGYTLWVAIADVSHYVTPDTTIDQEAFSRGTSVYFPERAFHMLPRALSENLCSLRPNEPRLTFTVKIVIDHQGKKLSTEVMESVIFSRRRATYNEIQKEWEQNKNNPSWEYTAHFELYQKLKAMRLDRGTIDFDFPEAEMKVKPTGEVESIEVRPRHDAHRLIEEFMIAANESVTEWALARNFPFLFRVHDVPSLQALERFQDLASTLGVQFAIDEDTSQKQISALVKKFEGHPAQAMLNMALLRSMKQAVYSSVHEGHYGLASEAYTHFTSPIRRYPDLIVHRQLRRAVRIEQKKAPPMSEAERREMEEHLTEVSEHCSYRERLASDAERESNKLKQVRIMLDHIGEEFDAKVNGMNALGLFIQLGAPYVEGMVPKDTMMDDAYEFNEDRMVFYGRRKKKTYQIGDPLRIKVVKANIETRTVEFVRIEDAAAAIGGPKAGPKIIPRNAKDRPAEKGQPDRKFRKKDRDRSKKRHRSH